MASDNTDDTIQKKEIAFYTASVTAWYNTSLEHDKSLFTMSVAGIGLLTTLVRTIGVSSAETLVLYIVAMLSFLICLVIILVIFKKNRAYIEQMIQGQQTTDKSLAILDNVAIVSFGIAVILSTIIGVSSTINSYTTTAVQMANENSKPPVNIAQDSFNGAASLQPKPAVNTTSQPTSTNNLPQTPTTGTQQNKQ
jgi:nitrogen fixation/metabolism regulation signal transduction histidine kinase